MRRSHLLICIAGIVMLLASAGCYTILRHPAADTVTQQDSYYRSCADCHADAVYYHPYYSYGSSHTRWQSYYGYPWWYHDYWWYPYGDSGEPRDVERGERHLWSPGGWASGGWGFTKGSAPPPPPERPPGDGDGDDSKQQETEDKDKSDQDDRHLWTKPKKGF